MAYPKWKYRMHPTDGFFQSTLVADEKAEQEIGPTWTDDPHEHGADVVPHPVELLDNGDLLHHEQNADANGKFAHGPVPTVPGIVGAGIKKILK